MSKLEPTERAELRQFLIDRFNLNELRDLAFDLCVDYEAFPHQTKTDFCRELIEYFERRNKLSFFLNEVLKQRQDSWLAEVLARLPACSPRIKIQIILFLDKMDKKDKTRLVESLARLFGVDQEEIMLLASAPGSIKLLFGMPEETGQRVLASGIREFLGGQFRVISMGSFAALELAARQEWRQVALKNWASAFNAAPAAVSALTPARLVGLGAVGAVLLIGGIVIGFVTSNIINPNPSNPGVTTPSSSNKKPQAINFPTLADKTFGDPPFKIEVKTDSGLPSSLGAAGKCSVAGNIVTISGAGSCTITASQEGNAEYQNAPQVSQTFLINKANASVTLDNLKLNQYYDGKPNEVIATTNPSGLATAITYYDLKDNPLSGPPVNAGLYKVSARVNDPNYTGGATDTLVVRPGTYDLRLDPRSLSRIYNGNTQGAQVLPASNPQNLKVNIIYYDLNDQDNKPVTPVNPGFYKVVASVDNPNYSGGDLGTLIIRPASVTGIIDKTKLKQTAGSVTAPVKIVTDPANLKPKVKILYSRVALETVRTNLPTETLPQEAGSYQVSASVDDPNFAQFSETAILVISSPPVP